MHPQLSGPHRVEELASVEHLDLADVGLEHVAVAGDQHRSGGLREGDEVVVVRVAGRGSRAR